MTPEEISGRSEHSQQAALFCWANKNVDRFPELEWMFAIPNGGERHRAVAARLKVEGVKAGVYDIMLPVPTYYEGDYPDECGVLYCGLFIEMKVGKNQPSDKQKDFGQTMRDRGYHTEVCWGWEQARDCIIRYLTKGAL